MNYSYFGARYYDSDLSVWLSVDPLSDKYPNLSPYAYCANNPVMLVDPDGRKIVDPKNGKQVENVDGKWRTIKRIKRNGDKVFGRVSKNFSNNSQQILDEMVSTNTGSDLYSYYQSLPNEIVFDKNDSKNTKQNLKDDNNSVWRPYNYDFSINDNDKYYNQRIIITPNIDKIKTTAAADGVTYMEKFLQVLMVEYIHIGNVDQIALENSYSFKFNTPESLQVVYTLPLNEAIDIGKKYRDEFLIPISESSNLPIIKFNAENGTNISIF